MRLTVDIVTVYGYDFSQFLFSDQPAVKCLGLSKRFAVCFLHCRHNDAFGVDFLFACAVDVQ